MDLPLEAIGPEGSNCFSRVVNTIISKETYSHLIFQGVQSPCLTLDLCKNVIWLVQINLQNLYALQINDI